MHLVIILLLSLCPTPLQGNSVLFFFPLNFRLYFFNLEDNCFIISWMHTNPSSWASLQACASPLWSQLSAEPPALDGGLRPLPAPHRPCVYVSAPLSLPHHPLPPRVHKSALWVCVSILVLQIGSSARLCWFHICALMHCICVSLSAFTFHSTAPFLYSLTLKVKNHTRTFGL